MNTSDFSSTTYHQRRTYIENYLLHHPLQKTIVTYPDDAVIEVATQLCIIPESLRDPHIKKETPLHITIYLGGMPHNSDHSDFAGDAHEIKLAPSLLTGNVDIVVILKPRGLTNNAYKHGRTDAYQEKVAHAATSVLHNLLIQMEKHFFSAEKPYAYSFQLVGFSEGSSQAISIGCEIISKGLGTIEEVISIEAGGLVGPEQHTVPAFPLKMLQKQMIAERKIEKPHLPFTDSTGRLHEICQDGDDIYVSTNLIAAYEHTFGKAAHNTLAAWRNMTIWAVDYLTTILLGIGLIPKERVRAALSTNPDIYTLISYDIPITVFIGYRDQFFQYSQVMKAIKNFRELGADIVCISADTDHAFPMHFPSGIAYMLNYYRQKKHREKISYTPSHYLIT
jgi:hypothetical protein